MTHSDEARWRSVQDVVDAALDLPVEARAAYIEEACGHAGDLRDDVIRLLNACEHARRVDGVLDSPAMAFAAPLFADTRRAALSGRYTVERELGRGGMATVYLARDLRHDRRVAVKVLEAGSRTPEPSGSCRRFESPARLTHPHVLGVHDSGEADGLLYYVMPYVEGETLRARLTREGALPLADGRASPARARRRAGLRARHGVMHRDLKPENVLISGGHALVADFGIAKAIAAATDNERRPAGGLTSAGVALGTPAYMAPEQAVGDPPIDHRADLYALGVIAYEALAGAHPFGARSAQQFVVAHLTEVPSPLDARRTDAPPTLGRAGDAAHRQGSCRAPAERRGGAPHAPDVLPTAPTASTPLVADVTLAFGRRHGVVVAAGVGAYARGKGRCAGPRGFVPSANGIRTLAVLPFVNTGGTAADDYFSDGMTDELAHALGRLPGLRFAGPNIDLPVQGKVGWGTGDGTRARCRRARRRHRAARRRSTSRDDAARQHQLTAKCCGTVCMRVGRTTSSPCRTSSRARSLQRSRRRSRPLAVRMLADASRGTPTRRPMSFI